MNIHMLSLNWCKRGSEGSMDDISTLKSSAPGLASSGKIAATDGNKWPQHILIAELTSITPIPRPSSQPCCRCCDLCLWPCAVLNRKRFPSQGAEVGQPEPPQPATFSPTSQQCQTLGLGRLFPEKCFSLSKGSLGIWEFRHAAK